AEKVTLCLTERGVIAAISRVKPIDFRLSDLLCGPLGRLPRRVFFAAFPRGFEVVACAVGRPRNCKSQCNDCNVAHQSIPSGAATAHSTQEPSARVQRRKGADEASRGRPAFPTEKPIRTDRPPKAVPG